MFSNVEEQELSREELAKIKGQIILSLPKSLDVLLATSVKISKKEALWLHDQGYKAYVYLVRGHYQGSVILATRY